MVWGRLSPPEHFYFSWKGKKGLAVALGNAPSAADRAEGYTAEALARAYRDEAIATYRQVIKIDPNDAEGYNQLGKILQEAERLDEAIATYQKAIQLNPKNDIAYTNIGLSFYDLGKLDEASVAYRQAIQLNPKNAAAHDYLAWTLQQQGKIEQAIDIYKIVIVLSKFKSDNFFLRETERLSALWKNPQLLAIPERLPSLKAPPFLLLKRSVVRVIVKSSGEWKWGTGWVVKRQGNKAWVVTNRHVATTRKNQPQLHPNEINIRIEAESNRPPSDQKIEVEFYSEPHSGEFRKRLPAKIAKITADSNKLDLALLEVTDIPRDIKPLARASVSVALKSPIRIIGHPYTTGDWTVTSGEVINKTDQKLGLSAIAASGNSGSPVLDQKNHVVGVVWGGTNFQTQNQQLVRSSSALAFPIQSVTKQLKNWGID
jgi:V8-like Glu-specific endopeptidase